MLAYPASGLMLVNLALGGGRATVQFSHSWPVALIKSYNIQKKIQKYKKILKNCIGVTPYPPYTSSTYLEFPSSALDIIIVQLAGIVIDNFIKKKVRPI